MADLVALVDKATSEYLVQTDWTVVLQICDTLNREPYGARDVVKQATKRMKEKKSRVVMYALELIETLVKNCECTHGIIGGKEFQAEFIKLIQNKKTKDQVRNRALELVQYWAESFQTRRDLPMFNQTNLLLRRAGITFPPRRTDEPPLVFKNAPQVQPDMYPPAHTSHGSYGSHGSHAPPSGGARRSAEHAPQKDLAPIQENVNLAMEMLAYTNPEEDDPASNDILRELIATCKDSMPHVRSTIESANFSSDAQMVSLLALNDELVKVQEMYEDLIARRQLFITHGPAKLPPKKTPQNDILDLADAFGTLNTQAPLNPPSYQQAQQQSRPLDLDFLSTPAQTTQPLTANTSSTNFYQTTQPLTANTSATNLYQTTQPLTANTSSTNLYAKPAVPYPAPPTTQPIIPGPPAPQNPYVNPFFSTEAPKPAAPVHAPASDGFDEFDMLAKRHSGAHPPPSMGAPLQPTKPAGPAQSLSNANLFFPTSSNPAPSTYSAPVNSYPPSTYSAPLVPTQSAPLVPTPAPNPYNMAPRATSPYSAPLSTSPAAAPIYSSGPLGTSPAAPIYSSAPLATSPTANLYGRPPGPVAPGAAPYFPTYASGPLPMQPTQPMQPMQPLQPNPYASGPYSNPAYPLPAGGYRPQ